MKHILSFIIAAALLLTCVYAHPGRTDGQGGHHDYQNASGLGSYHYHHGQGPHLHPNGVCPYTATTKATTKATTVATARKTTKAAAYTTPRATTTIIIPAKTTATAAVSSQSEDNLSGALLLGSGAALGGYLFGKRKK